MKVKITTEVNPHILECWIGARYWEDSKFNGKYDDEYGNFVKSHFGPDFIKHDDNIDHPAKRISEIYHFDFLYLKIDLDDGTILNWPEGITANFNYKSCDQNFFRLLDKNGSVIHQSKDSEYMIGPKFMNDYGDYFVPNVDEDGNIEDYDKDEMEESLIDWIENE